MGFITPASLFLGLAVAVPIILHLFQRHQGPRVVFPALRYLRRAEKENARRIRIRQLLLMVLRVAAVLLLAAAAARPFARSGGIGHVPTAVAIILDNSMSSGAVTGDARVLDALKARALETLEMAGPDDRFWLLRAGAPWEPALTGDAATTAQRIRLTEPTGASADLGTAVGHARSLLAAGAEGRASEIQLLSDLQATNFGPAPEPGAGAPALVVWAPAADAPDNTSVTAVEVGGGLPPIAGQRTAVTTGVAGARARDSIVVRLAVDGRVVAVANAPPGGSAVLTLPARPEGIVTGWAESDADALRADDRRYFAARVVPPPSVGVATPLPFVEEALAVMADAGRIVRASSTRDADVLIAPAGQGIEVAAPGRAVVVFPPESPLELPALNRRLAAAGIPWTYVQGGAAGEARFATGDSDDEAMRTLDDVRLTQVYELRAGQAAAGDTALLRLRDGSAWAVRGARSDGAVHILLGSPISATASTLPTSAAMLPVLDRLVGSWTASQPPRTEAMPGDEIRLPPGTRAIERPDGVSEPVDAGDAYRVGADPGIYRAVGDAGGLAAWAVNPPAAESDLARLDRRRLRGALPGWTVQISDTPDEWRADIFRSRVGREVWRPVLIATLLLLLVETLIAATGRVRRAAEPGTADTAARDRAGMATSGGRN